MSEHLSIKPMFTVTDTQLNKNTIWAKKVRNEWIEWNLPNAVLKSTIYTCPSKRPFTVFLVIVYMDKVD